MEKSIAYCGIDCSECPVLIATAEDDDELRKKTAEEWSKLYTDILESFGIPRLKPGDMNCYGCRSDHGHFIGCSACPIRKCSQERNVSECASCDEYESCDMLKASYSIAIHKDSKENLDQIRMNIEKK